MLAALVLRCHHCSVCGNRTWPLPDRRGISLGDMAGAETWHGLLSAIERLQSKSPADGEKVR
jgi:hypothetical protein